MTSSAVGPARYHITERIGRGGMGEVCLADDLVLHRQVALKFLTSPGESDATEKLLAEARAAAALDHPFICAIYDVCTIDDRPCIAMEYVRGETLERRLRRGPLALDEALRFAEEMAEALDAAHKRRIIHRDLKPANVMITEGRHVKVMDFGLASRLPPEMVDDVSDEVSKEAAVGRGAPEESSEEADKAEVVLRGTPAFMAPEQIHGDSTDRRSDIFSFGILLYQALTGMHPFLRPGVQATLVAILNEPVAPLHARQPAIPPAVSAVVARMLAKDPAERYQSFGDVHRDVRLLAVEIAAPSGAPVLIAVDSPAPPDVSLTLVGREPERAQLLQSIELAATGRGSLVVLNGEAGVGKTRLAEDALAAARRRGSVTLVGRCYEQEGTPPLIPFIEVLEAASRLLPANVFRQAMGTSAPELAKLLPELHRLFPDLPLPLELPPELRQRFLFTNIRDFLARAAQAAPIVILLDDLQWADEPTLQLTRYLAQQVTSLPILVIGAHRDVDQRDAAAAAGKGKLQSFLSRVRGQSREASGPQAIKSALDQLAAQGLGRTITLRPLTEPDVRGMLAALAGSDPPVKAEPPAKLVKRFLDYTGGNPFFVAELFRHLREDGQLLDASGRWKRDADVADSAVPDSVRVVLERRLQRISTDVQQVLRAAAVIGAQFELDLLEQVADVDEDALLSALEEAEHARLLKGPSGRQDVVWRFTNQLIAHSLADAVPSLRRQRLHARIADAMTRLATPAHPYTSEIAYHLYSAGRMADAARTAAALTTAGDAACTMYATEEAVTHYRRALEVLDETAAGPGGNSGSVRLPPSREASADRRSLGGGGQPDLSERLADLLALLGERAEALERYQQLGESYGETSPIDQARITRKIGTLHWQGGDREQAMACYTRAQQTLEASPDHIEAAHLYQELGLAAFRSGDNRQAIEWSERALRTAEATLAGAGGEGAGGTPGDPGDNIRRAATTAIAYATNTIGVALARSGDINGARDRIEQSVKAAQGLGLLEVACRAYANLGVLYSTVEPKRAIEVSLTGLELASKIGAASLQSYIYANLAAAYCALTDRCETEGLEAAHAAANLDRELGQLDHLAVPLIVIAQIHQCRGELAEAQRHYREALTLAERAKEPQLVLPCYDGLATIALDRGDRAGAAELMEKARDLCVRTGLDPDSLLLLPFLS